MKSNAHYSILAHSLRSAVIVLLLATVPTSYSQTVWNGSNTSFTQANGDSDVLVAGKVALSRQQTQPLYNSVVESGPNGSTSPVDTEWAFGSIANYATLSYVNFYTFQNGDLGDTILNQPMVLHLINENIYIPIMFTAWGEHGAGGFAYTRATPGSVTPPTPIVSITNPVGGAVFSAPVTLKLGATATVSSGTVTNVAFFAGTTPLGSVQTSPFKVTGSSLGAGNYSITAVATAAGILATSAVVSISVVTPVAVTNSAPKVANGKFTFTYGANSGLTYVVQSSSNLVNWTSVSTNVASSSSITVTNSIAATNALYYRVGRAPNP